jgi:hypothetical protein
LRFIWPSTCQNLNPFNYLILGRNGCDLLTQYD